MSEQEIDIESLTDEQIRELALKETPEQVEEEAEETPEPEKKEVFRREIDLGDGSGKQVFEADTADALIDKLTTAQLNATRKIRELSREKKVETVGEKEATERELTADEEYVLSQELLNHPSKTQKRLIEGMFGMPIEEVRATMNIAKEMAYAQQADLAANEFVEKHQEDFYPCPANGQRIKAYIQTYKLAPTLENLEKAYTELSESGLLEAKPEEAETRAESETAETQETSRIVKTESKPVTPQRRVGSGLTSRGRAATSVKPAEPTEDELYDMPLDKLEDLARKARR